MTALHPRAQAKQDQARAQLKRSALQMARWLEKRGGQTIAYFLETPQRQVVLAYAVVNQWVRLEDGRAVAGRV